MSDDTTTVLAPVRHAVTVPLPKQEAFTLFTDGINSWWPREHHLGKAELAEAVLEPKAGGRYRERGVDGSECDWGRVIACEPPERILVAWQITESGGDWVYDPDASHGSEFEVTFTSQPDGQTLVELEHRHIERHGGGAASIHRGVGGPGGWSSVLGAYTKVASAA
jgi:uncharacterized protein YndB with AHSA1/START domain